MNSLAVARTGIMTAPRLTAGVGFVVEAGHEIDS